VQSGKPLVNVAEDVEGEALATAGGEPPAWRPEGRCQPPLFDHSLVARLVEAGLVQTEGRPRAFDEWHKTEMFPAASGIGSVEVAVSEGMASVNL
jgi:hypothetical protein